MPMMINGELYELDVIDHDTTSELLFPESAESMDSKNIWIKILVLVIVDQCV